MKSKKKKPFSDSELLDKMALIVHELRTPLSVISSSIQFCLEKMELSDKLQEHLQVVNRNAKQASKIVQELLEFVRPQPVNLQPFPLSLVLESISELVTFEPYKSKISLTKKYPASLPPIAMDRYRLEQALTNLLQNAIDSMMPEGGKITIAARTDISKGRAVMSITDTGCGISKETLKNMFKPFFTTKAKGIGLGLITAKKIIEAHKGKIEIKSNLKSGTTITVFLPFREH